MTRVPSNNYLADPDTQFSYATSDDDQFNRELDVSYVARAVERHTHADGRGLAVARLASGSVTGDAIADGSIVGTKLSSGTVTNDKLATDSVTADKIAAGAVGASEIVDGGVGTAELATDAVTAAKIFAGAVTTTKLGDLAVTEAKLADDAVTAAKIGDSAVLNNHIGAGQILSTHIGAGQVLTAALGAGQVTGSKIGADAIDNTHIADGQILNNHIGAGQILTAALGAAQVTIAKIDAVNSPANGDVFSFQSGTGRGVWNTPTAGSLFPAGLGAWVATAAGIPAGWTRYSAMDGYIPVGAGTSFTVTYLENTAYGSSWAHGHTFTGGASSIVSESGSGGGLDLDTTVNLNHAGSDKVAKQNHTHMSNGSNSNTSWQIPVRGVVWITKS